MSERTASVTTRDDGGELTRADHAQQRHFDRQLEDEAQRASDAAEEVADDMRSGMWGWLRLIGIR